MTPTYFSRVPWKKAGTKGNQEHSLMPHQDWLSPALPPCF
jgi:hypothetical protein